MQAQSRTKDFREDLFFFLSEKISRMMTIEWTFFFFFGGSMEIAVTWYCHKSFEENVFFFLSQIGLEYHKALTFLCMGVHPQLWSKFQFCVYNISVPSY